LSGRATLDGDGGERRKRGHPRKRRKGTTDYDAATANETESLHHQIEKLGSGERSSEHDSIASQSVHQHFDGRPGSSINNGNAQSVDGSEGTSKQTSHAHGVDITSGTNNNINSSQLVDSTERSSAVSSTGSSASKNISIARGGRPSQVTKVTGLLYEEKEKHKDTTNRLACVIAQKEIVGRMMKDISLEHTAVVAEKQRLINSSHREQKKLSAENDSLRHELEQCKREIGDLKEASASEILNYQAALADAEESLENASAKYKKEIEQEHTNRVRATQAVLDKMQKIKHRYNDRVAAIETKSKTDLENEKK